MNGDEIMSPATVDISDFLERVIEVRTDIGGEKCSDQADDVVYSDASDHDDGVLCFSGPD